MSGSIRQRGPRSWQVRVSAGKDPATGRYRYVAREVAGTKRDAQAVAAELASEVAKGGHRHSGKATVTELLELWLEHITAQGRAPATLASYRSSIDSRIKPALGRVRIDRLSGSDLDAFYTALLKRGLNPLSVRKCHAILSAALRQALRWGWIDRSPIERSPPPSPRHREIAIPTPQEIRALLTECDRSNPDLGSIIYVAATTGLRRAELCGLRWEDVDFEKATVTVRRSISDAASVVEVKDTKTHAARRIAVDSSTVLVLERHRELAKQRATVAIGTDVKQNAYVWSQVLDASVPYRPDRLTGNFITLRDRLGLGHITFHSLRHFAATTLAAQGVGIRTIAGRLGHVDPNLTLSTYAHFLDVADREAATAMEKLAPLISPGTSTAEHG
jgi:integrase